MKTKEFFKNCFKGPYERIKAKDGIYLSRDETLTSMRLKEKKVSNYRFRVCKLFTKRVVEKKRAKLMDKRVYIEIYPQGYKVKGKDYSDRLKGVVLKHYEVNEDCKYYDATDVALNMRKISTYLPNCVSYLSKFHAKGNKESMGNEEFKSYLKSNEKAVKGWEDKNAAGYSSEGDMARNKSLIGKGMVYGLKSWVNLLRARGYLVKCF